MKASKPLLIFMPVICRPANGFSFVGPIGHSFLKRRLRASTPLVMRDTSASYWFQRGDSVRVVEDVMKGDQNLRHRVGRVLETWEKCEVDPTCCCAEQVDCNMAVRVVFEGGESYSNMPGSFEHYFAEEELVKVEQVDANADSRANSPVAFDGMGCAAFKLDKLQIETRSRRIASYHGAPLNNSTGD